MDENKKKMLQALRDQGMYYPEDTALEAGTVGLVQGATQGFGDELGATVGALGQVAQGAPASEIGGLYGDNRDAIRKRLTEIKEASPTVYNIGESTGALGSMAVPGAAGLKGLAAGAKGAALMGGLSGLGRSEADLTKGEVGEALADTAAGAGSSAMGRFASTLNTVRKGMNMQDDTRIKPGDKMSGPSRKIGGMSTIESAPIPASINTNKTLPELQTKLKNLQNTLPEVLRSPKYDDIQKRKAEQQGLKQIKEIQKLIEKAEKAEAKKTTMVK